MSETPFSAASESAIGAAPEPDAAKPETAGKAGRPEFLDAVNKARVLGLIELGHSRRTAGRLLGCAGSTITRAAARDPEFFSQLANAESRVDTDALKLIRQTASQERYWRAAAWLLERRNPEEYGQRKPYTFTSDEVQHMFSRFLNAILPEVPNDRREAVMQELDEVLLKVEAKRDRQAKLTVSWGSSPELDDVADIMPPENQEDVSAETLHRLELSCPTTAAERAGWIKGLTQDQVEMLLLRAHERPISDRNKSWINDLNQRLSELIRLRGGKLILQQFCKKGG
jgi:hypothetical protein